MSIVHFSSESWVSLTPDCTLRSPNCTALLKLGRNAKACVNFVHCKLFRRWGKNGPNSFRKPVLYPLSYRGIVAVVAGLIKCFPDCRTSENSVDNHQALLAKNDNRRNQRWCWQWPILPTAWASESRIRISPVTPRSADRRAAPTR